MIYEVVARDMVLHLRYPGSRRSGIELFVFIWLSIDPVRCHFVDCPAQKRRTLMVLLYDSKRVYSIYSIIGARVRIVRVHVAMKLCPSYRVASHEPMRREVSSRRLDFSRSSAGAHGSWCRGHPVPGLPLSMRRAVPKRLPGSSYNLLVLAAGCTMSCGPTDLEAARGSSCNVVAVYVVCTS